LNADLGPRIARLLALCSCLGLKRCHSLRKNVHRTKDGRAHRFVGLVVFANGHGFRGGYGWSSTAITMYATPNSFAVARRMPWTMPNQSKLPEDNRSGGAPEGMYALPMGEEERGTQNPMSA